MRAQGNLYCLLLLLQLLHAAIPTEAHSSQPLNDNKKNILLLCTICVLLWLPINVADQVKALSTHSFPQVRIWTESHTRHARRSSITSQIAEKLCSCAVRGFDSAEPCPTRWRNPKVNTILPQNNNNKLWHIEHAQYQRCCEQTSRCWFFCCSPFVVSTVKGFRANWLNLSQNIAEMLRCRSTLRQTWKSCRVQLTN